MTRERTGRADDTAWFESLYRAYHGAVLAYARRRVDDPDDVVSEVFATAWRRRARVPDPPLAWLIRTASYYTLHAQRSNSRRARLSARAAALSEATPDHAEAVASRHDAARVITDALDTLTPGDQELLRLTAWEALAPDQLADVLECSIATVRVRLHRARRRLAKALDNLEQSGHVDDQTAPRRFIQESQS